MFSQKGIGMKVSRGMTSEGGAVWREGEQWEWMKYFKLASIGVCIQGLGHNMNTPLSAVLARAEMLGRKLEACAETTADTKRASGQSARSGEVDVDKCLRDVRAIAENAEKLSRIIRNMMQKGVQEQSEKTQLVHLSQLVEDELKFLESDMFFKHEVEKVYELSDSIPSIKGVYSDFSQAIVHFVRRAMEAMRASPSKELRVTTGADEKNVYVEVRSTGRHMGDANALSLLSGPSEPCGDGGVGPAFPLPTVEELLEPYGATVEAEEGDGQCTVIVKIPHHLELDEVPSRTNP